MNKNELSRKKKIQATTSIVGSTLGLSALGTKGGAVALRRLAKPAAKARHARNAAKLTHRAQQLDRASLGLVTTASGVGGLSGYNFASIQREEAKREKAGKVLVAKRDKSRKKLPKSGGINLDRRRKVHQNIAEGALATGTGAAAGAAVGRTMANRRIKLRTYDASKQKFHANVKLKAAMKSGDEANRLQNEGYKIKRELGNVEPARRGGVSYAAGRQIDRGAKQAVKATQEAKTHRAAAGKATAALKKIPKPKSAKGYAAAAVGLGGATIATHRFNRRAGKPYNGWWDH